MKVLGFIIAGFILLPLTIYALITLGCIIYSLWREFLYAFIILGLLALGWWLVSEGTWFIVPG